MRSKVRTKRLDLKFSELTNYIDSLFDPMQDSGWVLMLASSKGRDHINGLFPRAHIEWRDPGDGFPSDWRGFSINLSDVVRATETKLPLDIMPPNHTIDDCNQNQRASLLAIAVKRYGGRAAWIDHTKRKPQVEILLPQVNLRKTRSGLPQYTPAAWRP